MATTIYADASGSHHDQPLLLVAGFFNSVTNWKDFGVEWSALLQRYGIPCLHQVGNKPGDTWRKDPKLRKTVLSEAFDIINASGAVSIAHFTPTEDFNAFNAEKQAQGFDALDGFGWNAFRFIVDVEGYCEERSMPLPEFVFESCDKPQEQALRQIMKNYDLPEPIFRSKLAVDPDRTIVALQAADFLAHEMFRGWKDLIADTETIRPFLEKFSRLTHRWSWADKAKLDALQPITAAAHRLERIAKRIEV